MKEISVNNLFSNDEIYLFRRGEYLRSYEKLGAHEKEKDGEKGYLFGVWAPDVKNVFVTGEFCDWSMEAYPMTPEEGGIWSLFIPKIKPGMLYKYVIETHDGRKFYKADPYAFTAEVAPGTASKLARELDYEWKDEEYLKKRRKTTPLEKPLNIYEVHCGSWARDEDGEALSYSALAKKLVPYVKEMGYTHIELMPVMEHPFDGSWGYQITGYYAPTSRYGKPKELCMLIDACHKENIGVIIDWVPGHFCKDEHGLSTFNGSMLFEKRQHPQWGTDIFDFGRGEVKSFLISNALFWIEKYHVDGIRVDGVSSMLYLNFGVENEKDKIFNSKGTEENLEASAFLRRLNYEVGTRYPDVMMIAEESTAWPLVTYPPSDGGLGFHFKWNMGWMNDTLAYMQTDFPSRPDRHSLLNFSMMYAFNENFILPLSHDEVVHGKKSLIGRMPGDYWRQFAGMRVLALYQMCHPGAKLSFMGNEIAQFIEWRYYESIEWFLADDYETHRKQRQLIKELNHLFTKEPALWERNYEEEGFRWLDADDSAQSIIAFTRKGFNPKDELVVLINFRPDTYEDFRLGVPRAGKWHEIFNTDREEFGGNGYVNYEELKSEKEPWHGFDNSVKIRVPSIGGLILKRRR